MDRSADSQSLIHGLGDGNPMKVFRWNALDVVARCPEHLACAGCVLWDDCGGRAKSATGFVPVQDLIDQWHRTSKATWAAEMMCRRPSLADAVYPQFDPQLHVRRFSDSVESHLCIGGMDFGMRSPHVMLWAAVIGEGLNARVHILDEYVATDRTLDQHLRAIKQQSAERNYPDAEGLRWVGVDPAGGQRNGHTGLTDIAVLKQAGYRVRAARSPIREGIEIIRRRLDRGTLLIDPRCQQLIRDLTAYRFDPNRPDRDTPLKDGPDHTCDALRYLLVNLDRAAKPPRRHDYLK
jgi:hypothetical protein